MKFPPLCRWLKLLNRAHAANIDTHGHVYLRINLIAQSNQTPNRCPERNR